MCAIKRDGQAVAAALDFSLNTLTLEGSPELWLCSSMDNF